MPSVDASFPHTGIETWVASLVVRLLYADWDVGTGPLEKSNQPYSHVLGQAGRFCFLKPVRAALAEKAVEDTTSQRTTAPRASAGAVGAVRRMSMPPV
jgi:hypothetical protein